MSEQRADYSAATATQVTTVPHAVTVIVDKETARFLQQVQTLRNQARRHEIAAVGVVNWVTLEAGTVIAFES